ncbi:MAG: hypothetical protein DMD62_08410 [Gemmatimonadetes bacterium]|nr:MAG: hypothetical protein DMD62_08410 [Gemmatimonadota bacterium]
MTPLHRALALPALLLVVGPSVIAAQSSQFGIQGLGTPGKSESARARATGGAFAPFDPFSPLTDAVLADVRRLSANIALTTSWRTVDPTGGTQSSLKETRFPSLVVVGPLTRRITIGGGFTTYLDRSYGVLIKDTIDIGGVPQPVTDEITSDGAITDLRVALAARLGRHLTIGGGVHRLSGSTREVAQRTFGDTLYRSSTSRSEVAYGANGASVSVLLDLFQALRVSGWARSDSKLRSDIAGKTIAEHDLPVSYGGGLLWRAGAEASLAGAVSWNNWSVTGLPNSHDTFSWSAGLEIGKFGAPFRLGARQGLLPWGVGEAPKESALSAGVARQFSGGRGRIDIGVERLERTGTGMKEHLWTMLLGLTVRP